MTDPVGASLLAIIIAVEGIASRLAPTVVMVSVLKQQGPRVKRPLLVTHDVQAVIPATG
ncbi:hypothetical protein [Alcanivorax hongdengensis]|uniref:hypothetical protein n=1 Tax=Alcanivorax hongdengensis TaxID=519051 RepID=UPI0012FCCF90|nr:hypothetical protein [Alcanivorax hongdengensis]